MTRDEWERRLYEKCAGWVLDAVTQGRSGSLLAGWLRGCEDDLKKTITLAWNQAQPVLNGKPEPKAVVK